MSEPVKILHQFIPNPSSCMTQSTLNAVLMAMEKYGKQQKRLGRKKSLPSKN